jgi:hypothetical protein
MKNFNKLMVNKLATPLSREGAVDDVMAGGCLPVSLITHPYTPLKRGIAEARFLFVPFYTLFLSFLITKHFR